VGFGKLFYIFHNGTNITSPLRNVNVIYTYEFLRGTPISRISSTAESDYVKHNKEEECSLD
jgi:hypothetical protein